MGELARRLDARDLWISRGHLWAAGIGTALVAVTAFALGLLAGAGERAHASSIDPLGLSQAPDDALVELLARVEATADPTGGVSALTFPDALRGGTETLVPEAPKGFAGAATVEAGTSEPPLADVAPPGAWTVVVSRTGDEARARALRDQLLANELPAWLAAERIDGTPEWRVCLGGFESEAAASSAAKEAAAAATELPMLAAAEAVRIRPEVPAP
jgi:hypothetical protein